ncbi:MAG: hypothetical protein Barrevirus11_6 [Barrevirus sp.]|uniref:Uncharacterized protein n=1 Tax=Barrevirus sp. TaxID=2487763 RepID=A0A3G4ZQA3_9VIRU|nr:MAG: hypothetical protein Barrevirus11_6 [Barrevirus sp.]
MCCQNCIDRNGLPIMRKIVAVLVTIFIILSITTIFLAIGYTNNDKAFIIMGYILLSIGLICIISIITYDCYKNYYSTTYTIL